MITLNFKRLNISRICDYCFQRAVWDISIPTNQELCSETCHEHIHNGIISIKDKMSYKK